MQPSGLSSGRFRFGAFILDVRTGELRKGSTRLRVPDQSIEVLKALLERPGELVTREELRQRLWAGDTFVDFEQGLNGIMRRLREALGDSADAPTFIETLPRRGYRFIGVLEPEEPATLPGSPDPPAADSRARRVNVRAVTFLIIGLGAAAALAALAVRSLRPPADGPAALATPVTSYPGLEVDPSVSPDGRQVVYAWDNDGDNFDIYVKLIGRDEHLRLTTNPAVERRPVWSPDGQRIAFLRQRLNARGSTIVVVPALGGPEQPVTETLMAPGSPPSTNGLSWTPDSKGLLFLDAVQGRLNLAVFILWIDSRERRQLTTPAGDFSDASPVIAPDGRHLAFVRRPSGFTWGRVFVQPVEGMTLVGKPRALTFDDSVAGVEWTSDSRSLVFGRGDGLWRIGGDGAQPQLVYAGTGLITPSVARHGDRLVFQHVATDANIWRVASPTSGDTTSQAPAKIIASTHTDRSPNISHDGRKVAFTSNRSGVSEIWVSNIDGSEPVQVTHAGGRSVGSPRWSPDGERIAFDSMQSGSYQIDIVSAHGGDMHAVTHGPANNSRPSWSTEGRWIYFASTQSGTEQIWKIRSDGSGNAVQLTKNGGVEPIASFDGTYVYYAKVRRTPGIWRIPVDGGEEEKVLNRGIEGSWGLTRQGIVLMDKIARPQAAIEVYGYDAALLRRMLLPPGLRFDLANPSFSVAPDGSWVVYTQMDSWGSDIEMIDGFR